MESFTCANSRGEKRVLSCFIFFPARHVNWAPAHPDIFSHTLMPVLVMVSFPGATMTNPVLGDCELVLLTFINASCFFLRNARTGRSPGSRKNMKIILERCLTMIDKSLGFFRLRDPAKSFSGEGFSLALTRWVHLLTHT